MCHVETKSARPSIAPSSEPRWGLTLIEPLRPYYLGSGRISRRDGRNLSIPSTSRTLAASRAYYEMECKSSIFDSIQNLPYNSIPYLKSSIPYHTKNLPFHLPYFSIPSVEITPSSNTSDNKRNRADPRYRSTFCGVRKNFRGRGKVSSQSCDVTNRL